MNRLLAPQTPVLQSGKSKIGPGHHRSTKSLSEFPNGGKRTECVYPPGPLRASAARLPLGSGTDSMSVQELAGAWHADCNERAHGRRKLMPHVTAFSVAERGSAALTPGDINASLFYQLAQFVVWGEQHPDLAASHPDLAALLRTATLALGRGGIPEQAVSTITAPPSSSGGLEGKP